MFDAASWAKGQADRPSRVGGRCSICQKPGAAKAISEIVDLWIRGAKGITFTAIAEEVLPNFGHTTATNSTVSRHVRRCDSARWSKLCEARRK